MSNKNENLHKAKQAKNDEFYTQYEDIQTEMNAYYEYNNNVFRDKVILCPCDDPEWSNFTKFFIANFKFYGLKKLICTSYADSSKNFPDSHVYQPSLFETESEQFDPDKSATHGKVFILDRDQMKKDGTFKQKDLQWTYLEGDGDFRSEEVTKLRDEADIIVTNPPFSGLRAFIAWIMEGNKEFLSIVNSNAITYKEVFPLIKDNKIWLGCSHPKEFVQPDGTKKKFGNICWFTNLDHGKRHEPMKLMTMADNIKYSRHQSVREQGYLKYDNYAAINVDYCDAIPSDCEDVMGVPISFLDKYNPEQFQIVAFRKGDDGKDLVFTREREREFNRTFEFLFDGCDGSNYRSKMDEVLRRKQSLCEDSNTSEDVKFFADYILRHDDLIEPALRERERENGSVLPKLNESQRSHQECRRSNQRTQYIRKNPHPEAIEMFLPHSTFLAGMIKSQKTEVKGVAKYARITIMVKSNMAL